MGSCLSEAGHEVWLINRRADHVDAMNAYGLTIRVDGVDRKISVKAAFGYPSHTSIYALIRKGLFPRQVSIGPRSVGWLASEVYAVLNARVAGLSDAEVATVVAILHAKRPMCVADIVGEVK